MKQMNCPLNGVRNIQEFAHGGEVVAQPDPNRCTDAEWAEYIFMEVDDNQKNINNNFMGAFNSSVLNNNILARLGRGNSPDKSFIPSGTTGRLTRRYFGPVNINKLRIRLLDEFGRVVPMNNMDYSFLLKFECLYEV